MFYNNLNESDCHTVVETVQVDCELKVQSSRKGYIFAIFIFHLNIFHGFKVLAPGQRGEISLPSRPDENGKNNQEL